MRKCLLSIVLCCLFFTVKAQKNGSVNGVAFDTISNRPVSAATVTVLLQKDSSLVTFTMTGDDGVFNIKGLSNGLYRLLITHVNYYNSNTYFRVTDSTKHTDLTRIIMNDRSKVLEEVVLENEAPPVTLINDTIQYNAGSFKVQPNASVEQLLKKLPGVKVEKDGKIKAQGEEVKKVLVDGKEFFGNDPKVATKNLPADAVDKVQVYDKQSDQAELTGFEDGNYEKTINLKLKQDKKKGMFGKLNAGAGNKERYEGKFNVNSFKGARQFSAIGMGNNTNAEGFSFMDILNFTGQLARMQQGGGGNIDINISSEDAAAMGLNPGGNNNGIITARGGGLNYNNIIGKKLDFQSNYFYNRYNPNIESHLQRQTPDAFYRYNENNYADNVNDNHRLNLNILYQADTFNTIRITPSFSYQQTANRSQRDYNTYLSAVTKAIDGNSNTLEKNEGYNFSNNIIWRKKFARKGRTFSMSFQTNLNSSNGNGSLIAVNKFYDSNGSLQNEDTLNQQSESNGDLKSYLARAIYTEPLWKKSLLEFSVGISNSKSTAGKLTYDYNGGNGKYDRLNDLLSNSFESRYGYTIAGFRTRTQRKNYSYSIGVSWQQADLDGKTIAAVNDSLISKRFSNFLPNANFRYNFSRFKRLSIDYSASTRQPGISQLQPIPDISNPLNIREGNPNLKQEYTHNIRGNLNLMVPYKNRNLFLFFRVQATNNKIVNYDSLNLNNGIRTTRPVNVNGVYNINTEISYSRPLHLVKGTIELSSNIGYNKGKQFINTIQNDTKTFSVGPVLRLDMNPSATLGMGVSTGINYNKTNYSLQEEFNTSYLSQDYNAYIDWQLPKGFYVSTDFTYTINSQRSAGFNIKIPLWNASISKQMLKFNRGELKFRAFDLLNRNTGISRNTNGNYIEDTRVNTLRQFFLLSFTYSLTKMGLNNGGGAGEMKIITR